MSTEQTTFDAWCIVEIFGHQQLAGRVTEQTVAGQGFVRVDVPSVNDQPSFTRLFGPGAIYSIIPTTEAIATAFVARNVGAPIHPWQLDLPQLPAVEIEEPDEVRKYDPSIVDDNDAPF